MADVHYQPKGSKGGEHKYEGWETWPVREDPNRHHGLVRAATRRLGPYGVVDRDDIIQEGYIGLLKAARTFEPERGFKFSTYAVAWIYSFAEHALQRERNAQRCDKRSDGGRDRLLKHVVVLRASDLYSADEEAASSFNVPDRPQMPPSETAEELVETLVAPDTERERVIVHGRIFGERSLEDLGAEFGVCRERIRQIEAKAFRKARKRFERREALRTLGVIT